MPARRGEENLPVRWAALLGTLGEADTRRVLKRLRCSNACIEETAVLVRETAGGACAGAFSSDTNRAIPSPALLPAAAGSHPSGRSSEKLPHTPRNAPVISTFGGF